MALDGATEDFFADLYRMRAPFAPAAYFDPEMDQLIYVRSDDSYRTDRVDQYLTHLWPPHEPKLVGVKIKGFRSVFDQLKGSGLVSESYFIPLCETIDMLLHFGVTTHNSVHDFSSDGYRAKLYRRAQEVVGDYRFDERALVNAAWAAGAL